MNEFEKLKYVTEQSFKQMHHELGILAMELEQALADAEAVLEGIHAFRERLAARG